MGSAKTGSVWRCVQRGSRGRCSDSEDAKSTVKHSVGQPAVMVSKGSTTLRGYQQQKGKRDGTHGPFLNAAFRNHSEKIPQFVASLAICAAWEIRKRVSLCKPKASVRTAYLGRPAGTACPCVRQPSAITGAAQSIGEAISKLNTKHALRLRMLLIYEEHVIAATYLSSQNSRKMTSLIAGRVLVFLCRKMRSTAPQTIFFTNK